MKRKIQPSPSSLDELNDQSPSKKCKSPAKQKNLFEDFPLIARYKICLFLGTKECRKLMLVDKNWFHYLKRNTHLIEIETPSHPKNPKKKTFQNANVEVYDEIEEDIFIENDIEVDEYINYYEGNLLHFGNFTITFDTQWTLCIHGHKFSFDPSKPLFTSSQFLSILLHFKKNSHLIKMSNFYNLREIFFKLLPFQTIAFTSLDESRYFIDKVYGILKVGNLKRLVGCHILKNAKHFSVRDIERLKNVGIELLLGEIVPEDEEEELILAPEMFTILPKMEDFPNMEILAFCIMSLTLPNFEYQNGWYVGQVLKKEIPHGKGIWVSKNFDELYIGFWEDGNRNGKGKYICTNYIYEGEFENDIFHGLGILEFQAGSLKGLKYEGSFKEGKKSGFGIQIFPNMGNGTGWYRGHWSHNKRNGFGEYKDAKNWKFGIWKNNSFFEGVGQIMDENNERFSIKVKNYSEYYKRKVVPSNSKNEEEDLLNPKAAKKVLYNGYYFRSRLEARWAIFFEYLHIDYLYEPMTFKLSNGTSYTPDFYLPILNFWIEIKPQYPTEDERIKAKLLTHELKMEGFRVFIFYGDVNPPFLKKFVEGAKAVELFQNGDEEEPMAWCQCRVCENITVSKRGIATCHSNDDIRPTPLLEMAYEYANSILFSMLNPTAVITDDQSFYSGKSKRVIVKSKYF